MSDKYTLTDDDLARLDDRFIQKSSVSKVMIALITLCLTIGGALVKNYSDTQVIKAELSNSNNTIEKLSNQMDKLDDNLDEMIKLMVRK